MVDIHCHILPEIDDGSDSFETTLGMAQAAVSSGTEAIICTSHCSSGDVSLEERMDFLLAYVPRIRQRLAQHGVTLPLYTGMELLCQEGFDELLHSTALLTLAESRYLLIEFMFDEDPYFMTHCIDAVLQTGLIPVVAHPERYYPVQRDLGLLREWYEMGAGLQANRGSILGQLGPECESTVFRALDEELLHCVASDAHSTHVRTTPLDEVQRILKKHWGNDYASLLLTRNPKQILNDKPLLVRSEMEESTEC